MARAHTSARTAVASFVSLTRIALDLPVEHQLRLIEALAAGELSALYAADDLTAACDKARDEMEPVERVVDHSVWVMAA